jgi:hypothetical protein
MAKRHSCNTVSSSAVWISAGAASRVCAQLRVAHAKDFVQQHGGRVFGREVG